MFEDILIKLIEDSPTIGIIGYIAYMLRNDMHNYIENCRQDTRDLISKIFDMIDDRDNKKEQ